MNPKDMPARLKDLIGRLHTSQPRVLTTIDEEVLAQAYQTALRLATQKGDSLTVTSIVSNRTGEGKLDIVWLGQLAQLSPADARATAWVLIEAASVAEAEAALIRFLKERVELSAEKAAQMLNEFRGYRDADPHASLVSKGPTS